MFSEITKLGLRKLLWLIAFWVIYIELINIGIYLYLGHFGTPAEIEKMIPEYDFQTESLISAVMASFGAVIFGSVEIFYLKTFGKKSFTWNILVKGCFYLAFVVVLSIVGSLAYNSVQLSLPFWHGDVIGNMIQYMGSSGAIYNLMTIAFGILISLFIIQIDLKLGQRGLWYLVTGQYHQPREEERAFMFLDIESSTVIAERIGHVKYYNLLNDFFADATTHIINNQGSIYQYIGDEISISWPIVQNTDLSKCIQCYFDIESEIERRRAYYDERYGFVPAFKAGVHAGPVTTGQIGIIKKELVHSGDVLNTASRIQGLCNKYKARLIVSSTIKEFINNKSSWRIEALGDIELRGKTEKLHLYSIQRNS